MEGEQKGRVERRNIDHHKHRVDTGDVSDKDIHDRLVLTPADTELESLRRVGYTSSELCVWVTGDPRRESVITYPRLYIYGYEGTGRPPRCDST